MDSGKFFVKCKDGEANLVVKLITLRPQYNMWNNYNQG
jgi:hypothetical protein